MNYRSIILAVLIVAIPGSIWAQVTETGFLDRTTALKGEQYDYQIYVPRDYETVENWPVILFLHGAGERGNDGLIPTQVGIGSALRNQLKRWPAVVVFPQVPDSMTWQGLPGEAAMNALDATIQEFRIDESRVYLTGLSMGGNGTWYLGYTYPDRFAALVPICGFISGFPGYPSFIPESSMDPFTHLAERIAEIPTWIFHGDADPVVSVEESRKMATALESVNAEVFYNELPGVGHNAWDSAYATEAMIEWLFKQYKR